MFLRLYPTSKLLYLPVENSRLEAFASKFSATRDSEHSSETADMPLSTKNLNGPGYIILNGIRGMNVVALLAVITASIVMLAKISTDTKLFFFDAVSHVVTAVTSSKSKTILHRANRKLTSSSVSCHFRALPFPIVL